MVCNNETKHCTKSKAQMDLAPTINLNLENITINLEWKDYVYFENDDLQCRFGDICDQRSEGVCADETEVVLGKLFFEKYTPLISVNRQTGSNSITLIKNFKAPKETVYIWIVIGVIAFIVGIVALVLLVLKRRKTEDIQEDDEYKGILEGGEDDKEVLSQEENKKIKQDDD